MVEEACLWYGSQAESDEGRWKGDTPLQASDLSDPPPLPGFISQYHV